MAAKEPIRIPPIGPSLAGSRPSRPRATAFRSGGPSTAPTATTLRLLQPTLDAVEATSLNLDINTLHLDRAYDYPKTSRELTERGVDELDIQRRGSEPPPGTPHRLTLRQVRLARGQHQRVRRFESPRLSTLANTRCIEAPAAYRYQRSIPRSGGSTAGCSGLRTGSTLALC
jgi:hypothetical protein